MNDRLICNVLESLTIDTHFRVWYWPLHEIDRDDSFHDDGSLYRDCEEMLDCEIAAVEKGTSITLVVSNVEDDYIVEATEVDSNCVVAFSVGKPDCIHHIEVTKVGAPPAEEFCFGTGHEDFYACPAKSEIQIATAMVGQEDALKLYAALGRWLRYKGENLT